MSINLSAGIQIFRKSQRPLISGAHGAFVHADMNSMERGSPRLVSSEGLGGHPHWAAGYSRGRSTLDDAMPDVPAVELVASAAERAEPAAEEQAAMTSDEGRRMELMEPLPTNPMPSMPPHRRL